MVQVDHLVEKMTSVAQFTSPDPRGGAGEAASSPVATDDAQSCSQQQARGHGQNTLGQGDTRGCMGLAGDGELTFAAQVADRARSRAAIFSKASKFSFKTAVAKT